MYEATSIRSRLDVQGGQACLTWHIRYRQDVAQDANQHVALYQTRNVAESCNTA